MIGLIPDTKGFSSLVLIEKRVLIDKKVCSVFFFFLMYRFCDSELDNKALTKNQALKVGQLAAYTLIGACNLKFE